jgi:hypothetical protein
VLLLVCGTTIAFADKGSGLAIGAEGALDFVGSNGLPTSAMLLLHLPQIPLMFGIGVSSSPGVGITADYWILHSNLSRIFSWYLGVGGYLNADFGSPASFTVGGRVPIGLQLWPVGQVLEIFAEIAPAVGVVLVPTSFDWHLQAAIGLRVWL